MPHLLWLQDDLMGREVVHHAWGLKALYLLERGGTAVERTDVTESRTLRWNCSTTFRAARHPPWLRYSS